LLSSDMYNTNKLILYLNDCRRMNIIILKPNINMSFYCFIVKNKNSILYGLGAIKGVGENVIADILNNRGRYGFFTSLLNFVYRLGVKIISRKVLVSLVDSGVFDILFFSRFLLLDKVEKLLKFFLPFYLHSMYIKSNIASFLLIIII